MWIIDRERERERERAKQSVTLEYARFVAVRFFFASANYANITIRPPHLSEQNPIGQARGL